METQYQVRDEATPRDNFTMLPNVIFTMGLSPQALALYADLRKTCQIFGSCWKSTKALSAECNMSAGAVSQAKKELTETTPPLIRVVVGKNQNGTHHVITLTDIWKLNSDSKYEAGRSYSERGRSQCETSNIEVKDNTITELEEFSNYQKNKLSQKQIDLSTKQVHDMVEHSKKAEKNKHQELPEPLIPLAKLFMDKTGIAYLPSQRTFWISSLQEWQTIGVTAEDVELAVDRMGGYVINSPKSLTTILNGLVAERKRDVDNDPRSKYTLVTED